MKKEFFRYGMVGFLTTFVNYIFFYIFAKRIGLYYMSANTISWCLAVVFAYVTNRRYVFFSKGKWEKEFFLFLISRLMTLLLENGMLYLFISVWKVNVVWSKCVSCLAVIIGNYVICKNKVFTGGANEEN